MLSNLNRKPRSLVPQLRTTVTIVAAAFAALAALAIGSLVPANAATGSLSTIKGVGQQGFISEFLDGSTIANSPIFDNQGNIGVGTVTPLAKLDVVGGIRIDGAGNGLTFADGSSVYNRVSLIGPQGPMGLQGVQGTYRSSRPNGSGWPRGP